MARSTKVITKVVAAAGAVALGAVGGYAYVAQEQGFQLHSGHVANVATASQASWAETPKPTTQVTTQDTTRPSQHSVQAASSDEG